MRVYLTSDGSLKVLEFRYRRNHMEITSFKNKLDDLNARVELLRGYL